MRFTSRIVLPCSGTRITGASLGRVGFLMEIEISPSLLMKIKDLVGSGVNVGG